MLCAVPLVDLSTIPERLYEAAFLPELWVPLLDDISVATESGVGYLGINWPHHRVISSTFRIDPTCNLEQSDEALAIWIQKIRSLPELNRGFIALDPFGGDWSDLPDFGDRLASHIQRGHGPQAGAMLELFNGEIIGLDFIRRHGQSPYDKSLIAKFNSIYPAFAQSVFLPPDFNLSGLSRASKPSMISAFPRPWCEVTGKFSSATICSMSLIAM